MDAFRARYGDEIPVALGRDQPLDPDGEYGGKLSNGSERITLVDASGILIRQFTYDDEFAPAADGEGSSLVVRYPIESSDLLLSTAALWQASSAIDGSPGVYVASMRGDFDADGGVDRADVELLYQSIAAGTTNDDQDLNSDGNVDALDADIVIREIMGIRDGDTDMDGDIDFADFLTLSGGFGMMGSDMV